jgi:hypothetical protein
LMARLRGRVEVACGNGAISMNRTICAPRHTGERGRRAQCFRRAKVLSFDAAHEKCRLGIR